jgi:hypothetical protein
VAAKNALRRRLHAIGIGATAIRFGWGSARWACMLNLDAAEGGL